MEIFNPNDPTQTNNNNTEQSATDDAATQQTATDGTISTPGFEGIVGPQQSATGVVNIADTQSPIVMFFGPPTCGKTMTMVRLTRYLRQQGYVVTPVTSFRPSNDAVYQNLCQGFDRLISNPNAASGTAPIEFLLVSVQDQRGRVLCQLLEAPGEAYFSPANPQAEFPAYVHNIINGPNRKIWAVMVEPQATSHFDPGTLAAYALKVSRLKSKMNPRDKTIFVFNKIDVTNYVDAPGHVNYGEAMKYIAQQYPGIFNAFTNHHPISHWWRPFRFDFVAFQTGNYTLDAMGNMQYTQGHDIYPAQLWQTILKRIRG